MLRGHLILESMSTFLYLLLDAKLLTVQRYLRKFMQLLLLLLLLDHIEVMKKVTIVI